MNRTRSSTLPGVTVITLLVLKMKHVARGLRLLPVLLIASLVASCTVITSELEQTPEEVAQVQVAIKSALIASDELQAAAIEVAANDSVVTLTGFVDSAAEADKAFRLAQENAPAHTIINKLEIR